jgi:alpha/beta hydrolase fold
MVPEARDRPAHRVADVQLRGVHARMYWPETRIIGPALVVVFGAGWSRTDAVVLATHPDSVDQACAVVEWAADHAEELGADPGRVLLAGAPDLAAAVAARAQERGWPNVALADEFRATCTS